MSKCCQLFTKGAFHLSELTYQTGHLEGITLQPSLFSHFEDDIYSFSGRIRGIIVQVLNQIVAFTLQTDGFGQPVLTKGNRPKTDFFWSRSQTYWNLFMNNFQNPKHTQRQVYKNALLHNVYHRDLRFISNWPLITKELLIILYCLSFFKKDRTYPLLTNVSSI